MADRVAVQAPPLRVTLPDEDRLPFLVRPGNVARYENGEVLILDRRVYPHEIEFVHCAGLEEVARAIEAMVTQSEGPSFAAAYAMLQTADRAAHDTAERQRSALAHAARRLVATRPTNHHIRLVVENLRAAADSALERGEPVGDAVRRSVVDEVLDRHARARAVGEAGADLIGDGDCVLTHCWAENPIVYLLRAALDRGRSLRVVCTETRPYLQGARLTADAVADLGIPVTIVTDGMPAHLMSRGEISRFTSGTDRVTMDGHVINKIGTLSVALAAKRFSVPYHPLCYAPDPDAPDAASVPIEQRDPESVLRLGGVALATPKAGAAYSAFDVTPPDCVTSVVTDRGVYPPGELARYAGRDR